MPAVAQVLPLVTARGMPGALDYLDESLAPVGTVVQIDLGGRSVGGIVVGRLTESQWPVEKLKPVEEVEERSTTPELVELAQWMADDVASTTARALALVAPPAGKAKQRLWVRLADGLDPTTLTTEPAGPEVASDGDSAGRKTPKLSDAQRELIASLTESGPRAAGDELGRWRTLEKRGLVVVEVADERRRPAAHAVGASAKRVPPQTAEQTAALARINQVAEQPDGGALLLHGVTGSGKTEVYLRAAQATLDRGRTVLVLVPEIGLAPQIVHRFRERFGDVVAVMHSGLSAGQRRDEWWRVRSGEATIVVGARSAVFAPLDDVGLVVVDEEHDASFKAGEDPRYDARRVAAWRARHNHALLLCGSATPRPESLAALEVVRMTQRVDGRAMPPVEVVNMRGQSTPLHPTTREALVDARKSIVLLNRRGWSNFLECRECGHAWGCPNCDVTLVLHKRRGTMDCHHCGHVERVPSFCPACSSVSIAQHGIGTERLESELTQLGLPVMRVDADVSDPGEILARFGAAERAVLVGTQLVAKGHDFPDVELGVVLDADSTLRFPDLRAEERTFQLVTQLAGRAGRGGDGHGRVIVQTTNPQHGAIVAAANHDADGFLHEELARRKQFGYPPYSTLVKILVAHHDQVTARDLAREIAAPLAAARIGEVLGPAPLFRLKGKEREQILVKSPNRAAAVKAVRAALAPIEGKASRLRAQLVVDVAPQ
ncbi:MAG: primosomal protein N' [Solirubrobacteraceae bacterium]|nr:primosomal protein N' [Solirubrobacteraceae bacterium]